LIKQPIKRLGEYKLKTKLFPAENKYFDYHTVELYKDQSYRQAAQEITEHFFPNTTVMVLNARLHVMKPGVQLKKHVDGIPPAHENFHVLHLPLKTNHDAYLAFESDEPTENCKINLKEGHVYELNYGIPHWGANDGNEERTHLFMEVFATPKEEQL
jgi:hypothetical protein